MTLFALLLALLVARESYVPAYFSQCHWGKTYLERIQKWSLMEKVHPALAYAVCVIPPVLLAWFFSHMDQRWFFSLIEALLAVVIFVACLHYHQTETALSPFIEYWRKSEWQAAYESGLAHFRYGRMVSPSELLNQTITQYWVRINQTLFAPLFWFAIFGISGLMLFLFTVLLACPWSPKANGDSPAWQKIAKEFLYALDGIPARAIAVTIAALCLNSKVLAVAFHRFRTTDREAEVVLKMAVRMGLGFQYTPENQNELSSEGIRRIYAVQDLRSNVLIFWLVIIAILTIIS